MCLCDNLVCFLKYIVTVLRAGTVSYLHGLPRNGRIQCKSTSIYWAPTVCLALSACNTSMKKTKKSLHTWVYVLACNICLVSREKRERTEKEGRKQALRWNVIEIALKGNSNRYFWLRIWDIQISVCRKGSRPLEISCVFPSHSGCHFMTFL